MESKQEAWRDISAKTLLSFKRPLAIILKLLIPEFTSCSVDEIVSKYINDITAPNSPVIRRETEEVERIGLGPRKLDLKFTTLTPDDGSMVINIEIESSFNNSWLYRFNRAQYYADSLVAEQQVQYRELKKVYSIWLYLFPSNYLANSASAFYNIFTPYVPAPWRGEGEQTDLPYALLNGEIRTASGRKRVTFGTLTKVIQLYIGKPDDEDFEGIYKLIWGIFKCRDEEEQLKIFKEFGWTPNEKEEKELKDIRIENNGMFIEGQKSRDKYFIPILAEKDKELEAKDKQNAVLNNENTVLNNENTVLNNENAALNNENTVLKKKNVALEEFLKEHGFSLDEIPGLN